MSAESELTSSPRPLLQRALEIVEKPKTAPVFFILTIIAVFIAGMQNAASYFEMMGHKVGWMDGAVWAQAGIYTIALMAILGCHEMGHWLTARRLGVRTSLPVFIPMPVGLGTFGAIISMKELPPTRRALLRIGAAGPLAGGVVAIAVTAIAIRTAPLIPIPTDSSTGSGDLMMAFGNDVIQSVLQSVAHVTIPAGKDLALTPLFFAGWAGLLLTTLNLFPVGQLDGGHVFYAIFGARSNRWFRWIALAVMALSVAFSTGEQFSPTYAFWGLLALFMFSFHPPLERPEERLGAADWAIAAACVLLFAITFMPIPIAILW